MELFKKARLKTGNSILAKRVAKIKRKGYYSHFSEVKSIGIVWDASRVKEFTSISQFFQKMNERNINVKVIGYYAGKELPDQYTAIRFLSCIRRNELNFFHLPVSAETDFFVRNPFDILIDINFDKVLPLYYITSMSAARFKVGLFDPDKNSPAFDLMIELKKPVQVDNYLTEIVHYLEIINSGTSNQVDK
jgi:hypothetical protein